MGKVLVCGSEGSLMQAVIPKLIEKGHEVYGADNLMRYGERLGLASNYEFFKTDLVDRLSVDLLMRTVKPDYVIQAAARIYGVGGFHLHCADILGEDLTLQNNVLKSSVLHEVKKFIYISSSMVYEGCPQSLDVPVWESMIDWYPPPKTDYGLSKFTGERLCRAYHKQYNLPYTIWRPFNIITPHEKSDEHAIGISHVFADFIDNIVVKKMSPLPIIGSGNQVRCFTWIDEVAEAIAKYSFHPKTDQMAYNLGNQEPITMRTLAKKIHTIATLEFGLALPDLDFVHLDSYEDDVVVRIPDVVTARIDLGWEAKVKVDESIKRCLSKVIEDRREKWKNGIH